MYIYIYIHIRIHSQIHISTIFNLKLTNAVLKRHTSTDLDQPGRANMFGVSAALVETTHGAKKRMWKTSTFLLNTASAVNCANTVSLCLMESTP